MRSKSEKQMKPLLPESEDNEALRTLGRATVQIVHDLKNQLNGLKLYATFLRKRAEKDERPPDELETMNKLITGLDRSAADLSLIVEFGQPIALKKQAGTDLESVVREVVERLNQSTAKPAGVITVASEATQLVGEFDAARLGDALQLISLGALRMQGKGNTERLEIKLTDETPASGGEAIIEWAVYDGSDHDPFHSFAGSNELRLALAARIIEAHGGSAERRNAALCVRLPLAN